MAGASQPRAADDLRQARCVARAVARAMEENSCLEAVTIDREHQHISVATLGRADMPALTERIRHTVEQAEQAHREGSCRLLSGLGDCGGCEELLSEQEQRKVQIKLEGSTTTIARVTCPTAPKFWRWRDIPWPKVVQRDVEFLESAEAPEEWKPQLALALICGVLALGAYTLQRLGYNLPALAAYALAYLAGSWFTAQEVWERLRHRAIDVHFLMLAVAVGSASIGAWGEGAMLLFLFSFSGALEHFALGRTQREIRSLFREAPKSATVLEPDGHEREVELEKLQRGMRVLVKPGAQFPVDGEVVAGRTASDESNLTGEATPVEKSVGDTVLAGTINLWGAVEMLVLRGAAESSLQKIIRLIREAQHQKAPAQRFTDRFSGIYTYAVLGLAGLMFFVWWLLLGRAPFVATGSGQSAFYHAMTLLVVASPCALVLSIPSAVLAAIAWGARHGILFRGGAAVEKMAAVNLVALDKTGTLTTGELRVESVETFPPGREQELAALAYSLERLSSHPLARAITRYGKQQQLPLLQFEHFESITGQGLRATKDGQPYSLGRKEWVCHQADTAASPHAEVPAGCAEIWVSGPGLLGRIVLRDEIRPQSKDVVRSLSNRGLRTVVLTGDRRAAGEHLRQELKIEDVLCELKPEQKLEVISQLTREGNRVAMVGDGVNDAPSLAAAYIGVAMGARGSDSALEQADVVLMHDRLENFHAAFRLSQRARRIIRQNLVISLGTVAVLVTFALAGKIPLTVGVVGHEGSTVIVVMNSLRLLFTRDGHS